MKAKYLAGVALALGLIAGGTALALNLTTKAAEGTAPAVTTVETDNCCLTGACCCPGQGACCDPAVRAGAAASGVTYTKSAGAGCCATGNCCCPGAGSCCATATMRDAAKSCCSRAEKKESCCSE